MELDCICQITFGTAICKRFWDVECQVIEFVEVDRLVVLQDVTDSKVVYLVNNCTILYIKSQFETCIYPHEQ